MRNMHSSSQATPRPQQQAPQPHMLQRCLDFLLFFFGFTKHSKWVKTSAHNLVVGVFVTGFFLKTNRKIISRKGGTPLRDDFRDSSF